MNSLKYLILLSFFVLALSTFAVHGSICSYLKRLFGWGKLKNTSYKMPVVKNEVDHSLSNAVSPNQNFQNFFIVVVVEFKYKGNYLYYPIEPYSFSLSHIDTNTKLTKLKKRIMQALPKGLYGLDEADIYGIEFIIEGTAMSALDNLRSLLQRTGTINAAPVKAILLIHPSNEWVDTLKHSGSKKIKKDPKSQLRKKKELIKRKMEDFFSSINIPLNIDRKANFEVSTIKEICRKQSKHYLNRNIQLLIRDECNKWINMLKEAYDTHEVVYT